MKPMRVSELAMLIGRSQSYIRDAIANGYLITDPEAKVTTIVGGHLPHGSRSRCRRTPDMFGADSIDHLVAAKIKDETEEVAACRKISTRLPAAPSSSTRKPASQGQSVKSHAR